MNDHYRIVFHRTLQMMLCALLFTLTMPAFAGEGGIRRSRNAIPGQYIVVLRDDIADAEVPALARALAAAQGSQAEDIWTEALNGFFARMNEKRAEALARHPAVKYVEEDAAGFVSASMPTNVDPALCNLPTQQGCQATTDNRLWHLDRVDQDSAVLDQKFAFCTESPNVSIYVLDGGVNGSHSEFLKSDGTSRVTTGYDGGSLGDGFAANAPCGGWVDPAEGDYASLEQNNYLNELEVGGHGTGVASLAAGKKNGVAKGATIVPVKIRRCDRYIARYRNPGQWYTAGDHVFSVTPSGSIDRRWKARNSGQAASSAAVGWVPDFEGKKVDNGITWDEYFIPTASASTTAAMMVAGLNWIATHHTSGVPAVATTSVFFPGQVSSIQDAAATVASDNVPLVASANNQNADACDRSPAAFSRTNPTSSLQGQVITVGGTMLLNDPAATGYDATQPTRDGRWVSSTSNGSNSGPCVTIYAPAHDITVATTQNATAYDYGGTKSSGTSWSAPITAGVIARYLQEAYQQQTSPTPQDIHDRLIAESQPGVLDFDTNTLSGTPNRMLRGASVSTTHPQDSTGSAQLSVATVSGATYQWYRVNSGFDLTKRRGAASSVLLVGETSNTVSVNPSSTTGYWVRVSSCGLSDSNIAVVTPTPPAPTGLQAAGASNGSISLSWNGVSGADSYVVERMTSGGVWQAVSGSPATGTTHTDSLPPSSAAFYRVRSRKAGTPPADSGPSNIDFAHSWVLTDLSLLTNVSIRALHLTELRAILNQLADADAADNVPRMYTNAEATEAALKGLAVDDAQFAQLMTSINTLRAAVGLAASSFTTAPQGTGVVLKTQIQNLRDAIQ